MDSLGHYFHCESATLALQISTHSILIMKEELGHVVERSFHWEMFTIILLVMCWLLRLLFATSGNMSAEMIAGVGGVTIIFLIGVRDVVGWLRHMAAIWVMILCASTIRTTFQALRIPVTHLI